MRLKIFAILIVVLSMFAQSYHIVDTGQEMCFDNTSEISAPAEGASFNGQDAQYTGNEPSYTVSGDGLSVYDNVTGLTWLQSADINEDGSIDADDKLTWAELQLFPATINTTNYGGFDDWRLPTIKELYSLIKFNGTDISGTDDESPTMIPFIDSDVFDYAYGDTDCGERLIDVQYGSNTLCVDPSWAGEPILFGVNMADGRIKGYDTVMPGGGQKTFTVICVRGRTDYGVNDFVDNGDGTIYDNATGLIWKQAHSPADMNWEDALEYAEDLDFAGSDNWRLPNVKELHSILDYTRSPSTTSSAAIDPIFTCNSIINEAGRVDYPWFWSSTTHKNLVGGRSAAYISFGNALGWMRLMGASYYSLINVHGAGAQRSDRKTGTPTSFPLDGGVDSLGNPVYGHGPQGDAVRMSNYVRCVRESVSTKIEESLIPDEIQLEIYPNPFNSAVNIVAEEDHKVEIFDIYGRLVNWGSSPYIWNPKKNIPSGVYTAVVSSRGVSQVKQLFYIK